MFGGGGYDAGASQFAGGGFMPTQADQGTSPAPKKGAGDQTLRALTIKQITDGTQNPDESQWTIDGSELSNVTLVGKLTSVQEQSACVVYQLNDGTGAIEVKNWIDTDSDYDAAKKAELRLGVYVRVHGHLRVFDGQKSVVAFNMRPITDFNEVTYHCLQSIFQHLHLTKGTRTGPPGGGSLAARTAGALPQTNGAGNGGAYGGGAAASYPAAGTSGTGRTAVQEEALAVFNTSNAQSSEVGISVDQVVGQLAGKFSEQQVRQAVAFLSDEGQIYSTIDDLHFKSCA
ncbi:hypothetical protein WJX84_000889 [Apatococcus fuscideae]|uniref:Replication protein A 32 kDa subunit n=1 Tax=Apatococcus fuscideae TaxID=2026836 RepID=A0AAW1T5V8_9CHLO